MAEWSMAPSPQPVPREQAALPRPRAEGSVWPRQSCPAFIPRAGYWEDEPPQCWFCRYADFHLKQPVALDVGICCWPKVQIL